MFNKINIFAFTVMATVIFPHIAHASLGIGCKATSNCNGMMTIPIANCTEEQEKCYTDGGQTFATSTCITCKSGYTRTLETVSLSNICTGVDRYICKSEGTGEIVGGNCYKNGDATTYCTNPDYYWCKTGQTKTTGGCPQGWILNSSTGKCMGSLGMAEEDDDGYFSMNRPTCDPSDPETYDCYAMYDGPQYESNGMMVSCITKCSDFGIIAKPEL